MFINLFEKKLPFKCSFKPSEVLDSGDNEEEDKENSKGLGDSNISNQSDSTILKDGSIRLANDTLSVCIQLLNVIQIETQKTK